MPVEWRLHVLEERLSSVVGDRCKIESVDLQAVPTMERDATLDALLEARGDFPVTLVNGVVACVGDIDMDAIVAAVASCASDTR